MKSNDLKSNEQHLMESCPALFKLHEFDPHFGQRQDVGAMIEDIDAKLDSVLELVRHADREHNKLPGAGGPEPAIDVRDMERLTNMAGKIKNILGFMHDWGYAG